MINFQRAINFYRLLIDNNSIRDISRLTGWSKSTVHNDLQKLANEFPEEHGARIKYCLTTNYQNRGKKSVEIMKNRRKQNEHNI